METKLGVCLYSSDIGTSHLGFVVDNDGLRSKERV